MEYYLWNISVACFKVYPFSLVAFQFISQAGIAARTLTFTQGSEEKVVKEGCSNGIRNTSGVRLNTTYKRHCRIVQVLYIARLNEKQAIDC